MIGQRNALVSGNMLPSDVSFLPGVLEQNGFVRLLV